MIDDGSDFSRLIAAVDRLTTKKRHRVVQAILEDRVDAETGRVWQIQIGRQVRTIFESSLFEQLDDSRGSSFGSGASSASFLANERSPLNIAAVQKWSQTDQVVWALRRRYSLGSPVGGFKTSEAISAALREWLRKVAEETKSSKGYGEQSEFDRYVRNALQIVQREGSHIRALLEPRQERTLPDACPACSATSYWVDGNEFPHPLVVRYRRDDPNLVENSEGYCKACETIWTARALAWDIENPAEPIAPEVFRTLGQDDEIFPTPVVAGDPLKEPDPYRVHSEDRLVHN